MPAIPAPTTQTSASIFLSSTGTAGSLDVADQSDMPSLGMEKRCDKDLATRRRDGACAMAFAPDVQLLPTKINDDHATARVRQGTVRIVIRLLPTIAFTGMNV
jgi:hypothetical protein